MATADHTRRVMLQLLEDVLSSAAQARSPEILKRILPFFRTTAPLFYNLSKDVLVDLAKNVSLRKVKRDHAIVWQGQEGKNFGVIIKGSAAVHARKEHSGLPQQDSDPIPRGNKDRNALVGPQLGTLATGGSFGEIIMTSRDHCNYNSTIVAEELTFVLLIDKELYERSFCAHRAAWQNKMQFVDQSPFFQNLTPAIKNLLMDNLNPLEIQFGNRFVRQGSVCNNLFFVCCGWGKVLADVRMSMTQYESLKAKPEAKDKPSGRRTSFLKRERTTSNTLDPRRPLSVIERRRHRQDYGYVAIETLLRHRESQVTTTGPNDIIGDIEIITNLPTYCANVECMENLEVYELSRYNFQQIIAHRCPETYNVIKQGVQSKLRFRSQRLKDIPLYTLLYERALSSPKGGKKERVAAPLLWKKKVLEVQHIKKVTGIVTQIQSPTPKATAGVETDTKEAGSSNAGKSDEKQREKKGPKQYTVEEFRALKKKIQAQGKVALTTR